MIYFIFEKVTLTRTSFVPFLWNFYPRKSAYSDLGNGVIISSCFRWYIKWNSVLFCLLRLDELIEDLYKRAKGCSIHCKLADIFFIKWLTNWYVIKNIAVVTLLIIYYLCRDVSMVPLFGSHGSVEVDTPGRNSNGDIMSVGTK